MVLLEKTVDIFTVKCDYICQQTNCIARKNHGFSDSVFKKHGVSPYVKRVGTPNVAHLTSRPDMGDIEIIPSRTSRNISIVCMHAQYCYGKGKFSHFASKVNVDDSPLARRAAFQRCLHKLDETIDKKSVVLFPYMIGCNSGGGSWPAYKKMITEFSNGRYVVICKKPHGTN